MASRFECRYEHGKLRLSRHDQDEGALADDEVRVAIEGASFGGRDLDNARRGEAHDTLGGGAVGEVVESGTAASEWLGRRVVVPRLQPCGECNFCRRGAPQGCADGRILGETVAGTLAQTAVARGRWLAPADGDLEVSGPVAAVLGDDCLSVYALYCRAGVAAGEPVAILGGGARSALLTPIATAKGARVAALESVTDLADVAARDGFAGRPWKVFAPAADADWLDALTLVVPAGSTIAVSGWNRPLAIDAGALVARGSAIILGDLGHPDLLPELVALAATGELDLKAAVEVTTAAALEGTGAAEILASGKLPVIEP